MHEDNQFGRCGRTLLWISDHILHGTLLSSFSSSVIEEGEEEREEGISNNRFYYGAAHDVHIDLLCASASSIGIPSPIFTKKLKETSETEEREEETDVEIETTPETKGLNRNKRDPPKKILLLPSFQKKRRILTKSTKRKRSE
uniref:Uncharacterized protein n=1 Tax=Salix viminalis TaxID=40686 RepID=A0A6N2KR00_SALVM